MAVSYEGTMQEFLEGIAEKIASGKLTYEAAPKAYRERVGRELHERIMRSKAVRNDV